MRHKLFLVFVLLVGSFASAEAQLDLEKGAALIENEQYDEARAYFEEANKKYPDNAEVQYHLGRAAFGQQGWDKAIDFFGNSVELSPENPTFHVWLGHAYIEKLQVSNMFKKKGLASKALDSFIKAVEVGPDDVEAREALIGFYLEAPGIAGGSKEKARENIEVVKTLDPQLGHELMAYYYVKRKKLEPAEGEYLALAAMEPSDPEPYYSIGWMYQTDRQFDKAFAAFEQCLQVESRYMPALYQIGRSAVFSGENIPRGMECLQIYLTLEPGETEPSLAWAHLRLGMLYEKQRNFTTARAEYETALALEPDHSEAKKALKKVKRR